MVDCGMNEQASFKNKDQNHTDSSDDSKLKPDPGGRFSFIWILLFMLLFFLLLSGNGGNNQRISYTEFKQVVGQGKVAQVTMKGNTISGTYKSGSGRGAPDEFTTVKPSVEDSDLLPLLENNNVEIAARSGENGWLGRIVIIMIPWLLIIGFFYFMSRRAQNQMNSPFGRLFSIGKSRARRYKEDKTQVSFRDVAGLENPKKDLKEIVVYLKEPERFRRLGAKTPKGILLTGPPGTGKTLLAKAVAGEADVPFYSISGSEFIEMFVGVGASRVRDMFDRARKDAPSIIFIDEIDSIGRARGTGVGGGHDEREQTLNQILSKMDGFSDYESVVVMAATNRPDVLDPALVRPGRFDRRVTLERPNRDVREEILTIHTREVKVDRNVELERIAARTVGFTGAELRNLVNEAALLAGRKKHNSVQQEDLEESREKIILGDERPDMINEKENRMVACHEAGHALMARNTSGADPLAKVTIVPRGRSLGATEQLPEEDRHNISSDYLQKRISIMLGGRAAEKIKYNRITNGAADDLKKITSLVKKMICQWGMSEKLGPMTVSVGQEHMFLGKEMNQPRDFSEATARLIDEEIREFIRNGEKTAAKILQKNRRELDMLEDALVERETLTNDQINDLFQEKNEEGEST